MVPCLLAGARGWWGKVANSERRPTATRSPGAKTVAESRKNEWMNLQRPLWGSLPSPLPTGSWALLPGKNGDPVCQLWVR